MLGTLRVGDVVSLRATGRPMTISKTLTDVSSKEHPQYQCDWLVDGKLYRKRFYEHELELLGLRGNDQVKEARSSRR